MPLLLHSRMRESVRRFASAKRSARTAKTYGAIVEAFLAFVRENREPNARDVEQFLDRPLRSAARPSAATYNQRLFAVRSYAKFAMKEGTWHDDPTREIPLAPEEPKDPAVLFVPEVQDFMRAVPAVSARSECARDLAILAVAFTVGLRVNEMVHLDVQQVDVSTATILTVPRKGRRVQNLPLGPEALHLIRAWLAERSGMARPGESALFLSRLGTRLSVRSFERLFERIRKHLGLVKHVTPHTARHSFVTNELELGVDITVVSRLAGHASITTTMRYRHLVDVQPRRAVAVLGIVIPPEFVRPAAEPSGSQAVEKLPKLSAVPPLWWAGIQPANDTLDDQENLDDVA